MTLGDIVSWLRKVEDLAYSVYEEAARSSQCPPATADFLRRLAEDEAWHHHLMGSAAELVREHEEMSVPAIALDQGTKEEIEGPLMRLQELLRAGSATEEDILHSIVQSESSEWNTIFLYVVTECSRVSPSFQYVAATIQAHENRIERFFEGLADEKRFVSVIEALPKIWENRLLVVEDEKVIQKLLCRVLARYGDVVTAGNGAEGLNAVKAQFFNVVITDVDMPKLNGLEFMQQAIESAPHLKSHFIICTGRSTEEISGDAKELGVPILNKPVSIATVRETVEDILTGALRPGGRP